MTVKINSGDEIGAIKLYFSYFLHYLVSKFKHNDGANLSYAHSYRISMKYERKDGFPYIRQPH